MIAALAYMIIGLLIGLFLTIDNQTLPFWIGLTWVNLGIIYFRIESLDRWRR